MNKTKIEWCDRTWNPVTGCLHNCSYCYARKIAERFKGTKAWPKGFEPTYHTERLLDPRKEKGNQSVFVCSMADLFGYWVPEAWQNEIFTIVNSNQRHQFLFLTKNSHRMMQSVRSAFYQFGEKFYPSKVPENLWFGTTITNKRDIEDRLDYLKAVPTENRFISFEPLLEDVGDIDLTGIKQVIIGAQTNPDIIPSFVAVENVVNAARKANAKVFFKNSMSAHPHPLSARELCWQVHK